MWGRKRNEFAYFCNDLFMEKLPERKPYTVIVPDKYPPWALFDQEGRKLPPEEVLENNKVACREIVTASLCVSKNIPLMHDLFMLTTLGFLFVNSPNSKGAYPKRLRSTVKFDATLLAKKHGFDTESFQSSDPRWGEGAMFCDLAELAFNALYDICYQWPMWSADWYRPYHNLGGNGFLASWEGEFTCYFDQRFISTLFFAGAFLKNTAEYDKMLKKSKLKGTRYMPTEAGLTTLKYIQGSMLNSKYKDTQEYKYCLMPGYREDIWSAYKEWNIDIENQRQERLEESKRRFLS